MYKIYINDKLLVIANSEEDVPKNLHLDPISYESMDSILENVGHVENSKGWVILSTDFHRIFQSFSKKYKLIEAAGGFVKNDEEQFLFIFRKGKWDLPKGKVDKGENIEETALREVKEECGIKHLELLNFLTDTYHVYKEKKNEILKKTSWYTMYSTDKNLTPQTEEDITEAIWLPKERFHIVEQNTYPLIRDLISLKI